MIKKVIGVFIIALSFAIVIPALAQNTTTSDKIACVRTAVATREATIATEFTTYNSAVSAAYATRANELSGAYSNTTTKEVQAGVKVSWADFKKSTLSANKTWIASRNVAWSTFRTAAKTCKAPTGVSDSANSSSEMKGQ